MPPDDPDVVDDLSESFLESQGPKDLVSAFQSLVILAYKIGKHCMETILESSCLLLVQNLLQFSWFNASGFQAQLALRFEISLLQTYFEGFLLNLLVSTLSRRSMLDTQKQEREFNQLYYLQVVSEAICAMPCLCRFQKLILMSWLVKEEGEPELVNWILQGLARNVWCWTLITLFLTWAVQQIDPHSFSGHKFHFSSLLISKVMILAFYGRPSFLSQIFRPWCVQDLIVINSQYFSAHHLQECFLSRNIDLHCQVNFGSAYLASLIKCKFWTLHYLEWGLWNQAYSILQYKDLSKEGVQTALSATKSFFHMS